jgi:hypothetical protein
MSSLIGTESERWSLARAIDALSESARQAGHPGLVWIAGFVYPTLTLGLDLGWDGPLTHSINSIRLDLGVPGPNPGGAGEILHLLRSLPQFVLVLFAFLPCVGVGLLPFFRLTAGLARIGPARAWQAACDHRRAPRLRTVWRAGKGLMLPTFGLWIQLALMIGGAFLLCALPVSALASVIGSPADDLASAALMGALLVPIVLVLMSYAMALSVLNQLALHSLAHNRRGVYSALLHGWRIMRNDGWATARAVLVDLILFLTIVLGWRMFTGFADVLGKTGNVLSVTAKVLLTGFAGVVRAGYWARAYRALGGLSPDDGVPGL